MRPFVLLAALAAASLSACGPDPEPPATPAPAVADPAAVDSLRADLAGPLQATDQGIAEIEAQASGADSSASEAFRLALDDLHARRRALQDRLDALDATPAERYAAARDAARDATADLAARVRRARLDLAPDAAALRAVFAARLAAVDSVLARPADAPPAEADSARVARRDALAAARRAVGADLDRLGGLPLPDAREAARALDARVDSLAAEAAALRP